MPELRELRIVEIDEPALPCREAMDEAKLHELAESMAATGLLQPISVIEHREVVDYDTSAPDPLDTMPSTVDVVRYEIVAGHRRFMAACLLRWERIRAVIYQPGEIQPWAAMLAENIHREDITAAEEALFFAQILEQLGGTEDALCAAVHKSPDYVGDRLRLLRGDPAVLAALRSRSISFSVARELNKCKSDDLRAVYLDSAVRGGTNARMVAQWVANANATPPASPPDGAVVVSPESTTAPAPSSPTCVFCEGSHDPYNMDIVYIHKWERQNLQDVMAGLRSGALSEWLRQQRESA